MQIIYEDSDITGYVVPTTCIHKDVSHGRADTLEISFARPSSWHRWGPETDDRIRVIEKGYDTGDLYLNTIIPEGNSFRMLATSLPTKANRKAWDTYRDFSLENLMHRLSSECGMKWQLYGIEGGFRYPYMTREDEGCAAFLNRIASWEGLALKAMGGSFRGISIPWAQSREAIQRFTITPDQTGVKYTRKQNEKRASLTIRTPWAEATAKDSAAAGGWQQIRADMPAMDEITAGRWARGLLLHMNRMAETLTMETSFNPNMTAMVRVGIDGNTEAAGEWIVDEAEHDIKNGKSTFKMLRVIDTIK